MKRLPLRKDAIIGSIEYNVARLNAINALRGSEEARRIAEDMHKIAEQIEYAATYNPFNNKAV
ncbi:MAG: hypothetical protein KBT27_16335 [Prevotellaceae bacterium]|nr:hypothetical protein [Candidatus Faecinaster equi]